MSLKKTAISGAKWTGISKVITTGLQFIQLAFLGHILGPKEFGLMAMVMVVVGFARAYMDMGISNALIYKQDSTLRQLSTLYWVNILAGIAVFVIFNICTPLIVDFYKEPNLSGLVHLISFIFLITPIGQQFYVLLEKYLRFKLLAIFEISSFVCGIVLSIVLALKGFGAYSLVWGQLAIIGLRTIFTSIIGLREFKPSFVFSFSEVKEYLNFGLYQMGEKTFNYFSKNIDYLLIGRYFGPEILGAYTIAFQLVIKPVQKINLILTRVAFPIFSKHQDENHIIRNGYYKISKFLTFVSWPILIFLAFSASIIIPVFFGEGWGLTIKLLPILTIVGLVRTLGNPSGSILLAKGRADIGFYFNACIAVINLIVFWIAAQFSVFYLTCAFAALNVVYFLANRYIIDNLIGSDWMFYIKLLSKNAVIAIVSGVIVYIIKDNFLSANVVGVIVSLSILVLTFSQCNIFLTKNI